jgi:hypothetical protein
MEWKPRELKHLRVLGRSTPIEPLNLFWTGSGVEFDLRGGELWAEFEADYDDLEPWFSVLLNGHCVLRQPLERGRRWLPLLRGLDASKPHHILILRETQPMPTDRSTCLKLHALRFSGELAPLPPPSCRIELLGDSLSSAEGALGGPQDGEWRPIWFSAWQNYGRLCAERLGGEVRILTQSGWGVRSSWDNDPACNLPEYYERVCGVAPEGAKGACHQPNDFGAWKPDVVVCALGTNDRGATNQPSRLDERTNRLFKQEKDDLQPFENAALAFLQKLRACNPDAYLLWMFFEEEEVVLPRLRAAMERFQAQGDARAELFLVPMMKPSGARFHPGGDEHLRVAERLSAKIAAILGLARPE